MTTEELMRPRYKVIADYPDSHFNIGSIYRDGDALPPPGVRRLSDYPHIFKPLQWWEERKESDMPQYVKVNTDKSSLFFGNVHEVLEWFKDEAKQFVCRLKDKPNPLYIFHAAKFLPATESEYINQKTKTP